MTRRMLLVAAIFVIAGCGVVPAPKASMRACEEITALELRSLLSEAVSPESMRARMSETFGVEIEKVEYNLHDDGSAFLNVKRDQTAYTMRMQGSQPVEAAVTFFSRMPTVDKVLECLDAGAPEVYRAYYAYGPGAMNHMLSVHLFIPHSGIEVYASTYGREKTPPALDGSLPVSFVVFVLPATDTHATMLKLLKQMGLEYGAQLERQLKPWPGSWQDVQIDIDPALR